MTRNQQRQLKTLKMALPKILKDISKEKNLRKRDYMLYQKNGELFFDCMIDVFVTDNNECICDTMERLKPMWIDNLFWEMLDMESNKNEPDSLRAIGAFTVRGVIMHEKNIILKEWSEDELRSFLYSLNSGRC